jgi:hypothetical protein
MKNHLLARVVGFTAEDLIARGLYELVRAQGITLHSAIQTVGARSATPAEAELLAEPRGSALLTMERVTYDYQGEPVELGTHIYAASRYILAALKRGDSVRPRVTPEVRNELNELFVEDNALLSQLLGKDYSGWLTSEGRGMYTTRKS